MQERWWAWMGQERWLVPSLGRMGAAGSRILSPNELPRRNIPFNVHVQLVCARVIDGHAANFGAQLLYIMGNLQPF